jgi:hypothetical protein
MFLQDDNDDDTILDEDVSDIDEAPKERKPSAREQAIQLIDEANARTREAELGIKTPADAEEAKTPAADEQLEAQLADDTVITDTRGKKVRIKVDGVEQDIDLDTVVRERQKDAAAANRLNEATRLLNEAKAQHQAAMQTAPVQAAPVAEEQPLEQTPGEVEEHVRTAFSEFYAGDPDAAVKAFATAIKATAKGGSRQPTQMFPSLDAIADQLQQRLAVDTALETIKQDYPQVIANSDIELLTAIKVNQKVAAGASRAAAMLESAQEVYASLGMQKVGRQQDDQGESQNEKLKRKAGMDNIRPANVAAAASAEDAPENPSALIRAMAGRRMGQSMQSGRR